MAEIVGAFPSSLALDERNNVVRDAEAYVFDAQDSGLLTPLAITDLQGVPFTAGKLVAANGIFPQFRVPGGVTQVYVKSGDRLTLLTDLSVYASTSQDAADRADYASAAAEAARQEAVVAADLLRSLADAAGIPLVENMLRPGTFTIVNPFAVSENPDRPGTFTTGGAA